MPLVPPYVDEIIQMQKKVPDSLVDITIDV